MPLKLLYPFIVFWRSNRLSAYQVVRHSVSYIQIVGDKMTNEQRLLCYLYSVDSIQRRQLVIALSDMPYQSVTLAVKALPLEPSSRGKPTNRIS